MAPYKKFVKVRAKSPHIDLKLFVPEKEIGKKLEELQLLHSKTAPTGNTNYRPYTGWVDDNYLTVVMKRVCIDSQKAKRLKPVLDKLNVPVILNQ